ncbi:MAG: cellulase family glycosylhydrolase [Nitrospira defluvii]|nr:cellulase family glycosylhydrolase [Nitrospira defluvii]
MMQRFLCMAALIGSLVLLSPSAHAVTLGTNASGQFTLNGTPTFLLGTSYYDALRWHQSDLDDLHVRGFNLIRVMLDIEWNVCDGGQSVFTADGSLKATEKTALHALITAANALGMIVDLTVLYADTDGANSACWIQTVAARKAAIQNAVAEFSVHTNVLFDLVNEHDGGSFSASEADMGTYMAAALAGNPAALLTYSSAESFGPHLLSATTDAPMLSGIQAEVSNGIKILTPHNLRGPDWDTRTAARALSYRQALVSLGHAALPVYFQEENRRGGPYGLSTAAQFLNAAAAAKANGVAAWIFHTAAAFDLLTATYMSQLDSVELSVVNTLATSLGLPLPPPPAVPPTTDPAIVARIVALETLAATLDTEMKQVRAALKSLCVALGGTCL